MAQQKRGFITRLLEGKEKSEESARSTLPTNRWQLFWDIFKGNFGKIVKVNLLILIFFIPMTESDNPLGKKQRVSFIKKRSLLLWKMQQKHRLILI